jgi:putative toxin-antitoxin system antitoxin component (TIGR02293 family)
MTAKKQNKTDKPASRIWKESKSLAGSALKSTVQQEQPSGSAKTRPTRTALAGAILATGKPGRAPTETDSGENFWSLVIETASSSEQERIAKITLGYPADYLITVRAALALTTTLAEQLFSVSQSTLLRRLKGRQRLSPVTSERLDRLASVAKLAHEVLEDRDRALSWLSSPNLALGNQQPIMLCETEIGTNQVRRVLHALEWGGVA